MFGIGSTELLVILVVALIVLGPKSLATVSRSLGKAMGEFRRVSTDFQRTLNIEAAEAEEREKAEDRRKAARENAANTVQKESPERPINLAKEKDRAASPLGSIPPDSPIAEAIEKARKEAAAAKASTPGSAPDGNNHA